MKRKLIFLLMLLMIPMAFADITGNEVMERDVPAQVSPGQQFTLTYTVSNSAGAWGASIEDSVTGGCKFPSGDTAYKSVMLSEDGNTKSIVITAPSSGSCTFVGDYKFGSFAINDFTDDTVVVTTSGGTSWCVENGKVVSNSDGVSKADVCVDLNTLKDYYCLEPSQTTILSANIGCDNGCDLGVCVGTGGTDGTGESDICQYFEWAPSCEIGIGIVFLGLIILLLILKK